ncbi:MAG: AAA family ATPase [Planctomycetes bacterium]|nr:AAA family ATPase [Planctomycetota bacterium]
MRLDSTGEKQIRQLACIDGKWRAKAMPKPRPLFRLMDLGSAAPRTPILVVEGEKCVEAACEIGLLATTSAGGSKAACHSDWRPLQNRDVIVVPDNDDAGEGYYQVVADALRPYNPSRLRVLRLPGLPPRGDIVDWLAQRPGRSAFEARAAFEELVRTHAVGIPTTQQEGLARIRSFDQIEPEEVAWMWRGRIALGRLTLLVGVPGGGKSFVCCDLAARLSRGREMPDSTPGLQGDTIMLACEDDPADTLRPRLDALGADVGRVHLLEGVNRNAAKGNVVAMFTLADIDALEDALERHPETRLVVIDPIGSYLGAGVDAYRDNEVRGVLAPLADLARRRAVAVVLVAHRRKAGNGSADETALGSRAFTGIARSVLHLFRPDPRSDRRTLAPGKNNLGPDTYGLSFRIAHDPVSLTWDQEPVRVHADELLARESRSETKPGPAPTKRDAAVEWLRCELADGPRHVEELQRETKAAGMSWSTVQRARKELGITPTKLGMQRGWSWSLPPTDEEPTQP